MKSAILAAVILQLVITIIGINGEYQFGDIIQFPRKCNKGTPTYIHYAVYVGPETGRNVSQGDNDIVHRTGPILSSNCRFDKLANAREDSTDKKANYLDGIDDFKPGTPEEITERIKEAMKKCRMYDLFTNNCEHFATFIRYGKKHSLQCGARGERFINIRTKARALVAKLKNTRRRRPGVNLAANKSLGSQSCQPVLCSSVFSSHDMGSFLS